MNYAKLSRRFFAYYFDSIIVSGITSALLLFLKMFSLSISLEGLSKGDFSFFSKFYLLYLLLYLVYEVAFLVSPLSSTPGKLILELEVVSYNSSFIKVFIRSLVKVISTLPGLIFISGLVASFTEKKQSFHDMLAGTFVTDSDARNHSFSNKMDSPEFHAEMKKRGIKTFSQQQALAQEMFGKTKNSADKSFLVSPLLWIIVLIICVIIGFVYSGSLISELEKIFAY